MSDSLPNLRTEILNVDSSNWLYPSDGDIHGFDGEGPFMFLSYRPSKNPWTSADLGRRRLYGTLTRLGLGTCHLSDCIKLRSLVADDKKMPNNLDWHIDILHREIKLIHPPALIVAGRKAHGFVEKHLGDLDTPRVPIIHYSHRFASDEDVTLDLLGGVLESLKQLLTRRKPL